MIFRFVRHSTLISLMSLCAFVPLASAQTQTQAAVIEADSTADSTGSPDTTATAAMMTDATSTDLAATNSSASDAAEAPTPTVAPQVAPTTEKEIEYSKGTGKLTAENVSYVNGVLIAEGKSGVVFETPDTRVQAERIELDTARKTLRARGKVVIERQRVALVKPLVSKSVVERGIDPGKKQRVTETLRGQDFVYDFAQKRGSLDQAELQMTGFSVTTEQLTINGRLYTARDVVLLPGGLTARERAIYGTPPFSLRAKIITVETLNDGALDAPNVARDNANVSTVSTVSGTSSTRSRVRIAARRAFLYFGKTRLLPVPSYVFNQIGNAPRAPQAFTLTPRINVNSADGFLLTTQLGYGFSPNPDGAALIADIGVSQKLGFRGGIGISAPTRLGTFSLGLRHSDIVSTQLTNRIVLDRMPEFAFESGLRPLFKLPGGRIAGLKFSASAGNYNERFIDSDSNRVKTSRVSGALEFTTRGAAVSGPYLDLFAHVSRYGNHDGSYRTAGFEVGYAGQILPKLRGAISYRGNSISGDTPFRFDQVEIRRELRTTLDFSLSPRYIIPIDLRYDLDQKKLRDQSYGILRSYKDFAYGLVYQSARKEVRVEVRQGF